MLIAGMVLCAAALGVFAPEGDVRKSAQEDAAARHRDTLRRLRAGERLQIADLDAAARWDVGAMIAVMQDRELGGVTRFTAANVLGRVGGEQAVAALIAALDDSYFNLRRCAAVALGGLGVEEARARLEELARSDPYAYRDPETGESHYLVRQAAVEALTLLDAPRRRAEEEVFGAEAAPAEFRAGEIPRGLPWPFPGGFRDQNVYNGYQQPTDTYVHAALDLLQPAGTVVHAVDAGTVALIATNYPDWDTHHYFVVVPAGKAGEGWCYTHVDPASYTFAVGDTVERGAPLGKLVDFSVGERKGVDHLHLHYVRFEEAAEGRYEVDSLFDPLACFVWEDELPPTVHWLRFFRDESLEELDAEGSPPPSTGRSPRSWTTRPIPTVSGDVDVLAAISDQAHEEHVANWGVPWVALEITGSGIEPWRKLVLDQRGRIGETRAAATLYLRFQERRLFTAGLQPNPVVHVLRATNTDGDGVLEATDGAHAWQTAAVDADGRRRFPDGVYTVTVTARDLAGNEGAASVRVRVAND